MVVPFIVVILFQIIPFYFYFPETKGMSNTVIANMFKIDKPWKSAIGLKKTQLNNSISSLGNSKSTLNGSCNVETLSIKTISSEI